MNEKVHRHTSTPAIWPDTPLSAPFGTELYRDLRGFERVDPEYQALQERIFATLAMLGVEKPEE